MSHQRFSANLITALTVIVVGGIAVASSACSKSSSSGDTASSSASAEPSSVALALPSSDAPKATPNSNVNAQVPVGGAGPWDHHCDIVSTRTCVEWLQADKSECDAAHGTYGAGPCVRTGAVLGTCVLATGTTPTGDPAPVKRILYNAGAGGAMKADAAHTLCDREQLAVVPDAKHMWKDGPGGGRR